MRLFLYFIFFFSAIISSTPSYSIDELAYYKKECSKLGFAEGTEKFGDCVLKLLEKLPSKKINFEPMGFSPGLIFQDTEEMCLKAKKVNGWQAFLWLRWGDDGNCPSVPELYTGYAGQYSGQELVALFKVEKGLTKEETHYNNGEKLSYRQYKNGIPHGVFERYRRWLRDGSPTKPQLSEKAHYRNGEKHGDWLFYNSEKVLHQKWSYNMGDFVSTTCYLPKKKIHQKFTYCPGVFN